MPRTETYLKYLPTEKVELSGYKHYQLPTNMYTMNSPLPTLTYFKTGVQDLTNQCEVLTS